MLPWLLVLWLLPALAAAQESARLQAQQLLEWSGALALLDQAELVATLSLRAEAQRDSAGAVRSEALQRRLGDRFDPAVLRRRLVDFVAGHRDPAAFAAAAELLQQPLAKRVRFFELAMSRAGAARGLREALAQPPLVADPARLALMREIDDAVGESQRVALLQSLVARAVQQEQEQAAGQSGQAGPAAGVGASKVALEEEVARRQQYLAPLTEQYLLHAYRYLKSEELQAYRELWRDPHLQWLQQVSAQGLEAVLAP